MQTPSLEFHFAPLQGFTDSVFRTAFSSCFGGVDCYYTPFVRIEKGEFRRRDIRELGKGGGPLPLVPQMLPGNAGEFRRLAGLFSDAGFRSADINLGCPFPLIAGKHKGAGMLPYPDEVASVLEVTKEYPSLSFSVKMRLGWQSAGECLELAGLLNGLPLHHVTLHARTGKQQYKGEVDFDAFGRFYEVCRLPLFYNGDIRTADDIRSISLRFPGLKGMAVGRGLLADPFLLREFREGIVLDKVEKRRLCRNFHDILLAHYRETLEGESHLLQKMKGLWEYFLSGSDRKALKRIHKSVRMDRYLAAVGTLFNEDAS